MLASKHVLLYIIQSRDKHYQAVLSFLPVPAC